MDGDLPAPAERELTGWRPDEWRYIEWLALPRELREPRSVEALAREMGYSRVTLWEWSKKPGFSDAVIQRTRELVRTADVPALMHSHARKGLEDVASATLVLKAVNVLGDTHAPQRGGPAVVIYNDARQLPADVGEVIDAIAD